MLYNQSEFATFTSCSRQNISKAVSHGLLIKTDDGKIDPDDPVNKNWIESHFVHKSISDIRTGESENPVKKIKKYVKNDEIKNPYHNRNKMISVPEFTAPDGTAADPQKMNLAQRKVFLEVAKLNEQYEKLKIENQKARSDLVDIETIGNTVFGYLSALNKNILELPVSYIDEFTAKLQMGKTRAELTDILRKPITQVIYDTKTQIQKEIERYRREIKEENKEEEEEEKE